MRFTKTLLIASIASASTAFPAFAQEVSGGEVAAVSMEEIIVTARRRGETLQEVPSTVNAVSSETIQKLRINNAADIAQIVPGITIEGSSTGGSDAFGASSGIRGVPTFLKSNASPIVQFYLNDAPTGRGPGATQQLFDIGQIEVLKGPQGTLRGRSAPTGAITITTQQPDLQEMGGFVNLSGTERGNYNIQGAVGIPIIEDVLAIRLAGAIDDSDGSGVKSVNSRSEPLHRNEAVRGTLRFSPNEYFDANIMYQRLWTDRRSYTHVFGPGNGANGPALKPGDRRGITDGANRGEDKEDLLVGQMSWRFSNQVLDYVGSFRRGRSDGQSPQDGANVVPGVEYYQFTRTPSEETSHELRLSSDERIFGIFDYTLGAFYDKEFSHPRVSGVAAFLSGAFGPPGMPMVQDPLDRYTLRTLIEIDPVAIEKSFFGSITAHLGEATELSIGGRQIDFERNDRFSLGLLGGFNALNNPTGGFLSCEQLGGLNPALAGSVSSPVYPGVCDLPIMSNQLQNVARRDTFTPFIYNISLSHKFTPDFMVYGNVGTAFRSAGPQVGLTSLLSCCTQVGGPDLGSIEDLIFQDEEKSRTYEIGFKSTLWDQRVRFNLALFSQTFDNFFFLTQSTRYLSVTDPMNPANNSVGSSEFTTGADAKVHGVDIEAWIQLTPRWDVNLGFTWSKAELDDALIPCNDGNFDGVVDDIVPTAGDFVAAGVMVARCRSSESISRTPKWNLTVQSEYHAPIMTGAEGFIRGSFAYYPRNPNASQGVTIDSYSLLNLFAGIRSSDYAWEVSVFANNILNTREVLSINPVEIVSSASVANTFGQPASGYHSVSYTPRREYGLMVRYAFGSK